MLYIIEKKNNIDQTIPILLPLLIICKKSYKSKIEIKKEYHITDSIGIQQVEEKNKGNI